MHPDLQQLSAYLDDALDAETRAELRAHILTCSVCSGRLEQLRSDAQLITRAIASGGPTPDVRAAVRARLRRRGPLSWVARGGALASGFAGAVAALLLFAVLIGTRSGDTFGRIPDRLFVVTRTDGQLIALDPASGAHQDSLDVGDSPSVIRYDGRRGRLYVLLARGVVAVDPLTLTEIDRWDADQSLGTSRGMALDEERGRLYISWPGAGMLTVIDAMTLAPLPIDVNDIAVSARIVQPGALVLSPDGHTLYTLDESDWKLWTINLTSHTGSGRLLDGSDVPQDSYLELSPDGQSLYVLRRLSEKVWRVDTGSGQISGPYQLAERPQGPWDLLLIDTTHLAFARGDGSTGGIEVVDTATFSTTAHIEPAYDEHHLAAGPAGSVFGLNFTRDTVTRYSVETQTIIWRTTLEENSYPWDGVYVRGRWRWPW
jgi:sugar lactone lactonase YvrE